MYSIGYKFNFDNVKPEDIELFLKDYLKQFDRYEVKFTKKLLSSGKIELLLDVSEKLAIGRYSLHILKDVLNNLESFNILVNLIKVLEKFEISNEVFLVTHIPYGNAQEYSEKILEISKYLPENYILLFENELIINDNENYLKQINNICDYLTQNNINNIGICLDIGHLLFGFSKENISEENALNKLQEMFLVLPRIREIHIHDYLEKDHLKITDGVMDLSLVSEFIKKNDLHVPIIIEASVTIPDEGIEQSEILKESLKRNKIKNNDL